MKFHLTLHKFSFKKIHLKILLWRYWPFCLSRPQCIWKDSSLLIASMYLKRFQPSHSWVQHHCCVPASVCTIRKVWLCCDLIDEKVNCYKTSDVWYFRSTELFVWNPFMTEVLYSLANCHQAWFVCISCEVWFKAWNFIKSIITQCLNVWNATMQAVSTWIKDKEMIIMQRPTLCDSLPP